MILGNWAIFYFSIMLMHKEVWGKLVTFDLFSAWDWGLPGNVLAEHMGFIKASCRVSWLFIFLSFRNLTPLIRLNIWNKNLFLVSQLRSIAEPRTLSSSWLKYSIKFLVIYNFESDSYLVIWAWLPGTATSHYWYFWQNISQDLFLRFIA